MIGLIRLILSFIMSLLMGFLGSFSPPLTFYIDRALVMRNQKVMMLAQEGRFPDSEYGVIAMGMTAFTPTFTLTSSVNGYRILEDTPTHTTVWVDEALTIHWKTDSRLGNVDIMVFGKEGNRLHLLSMRWWADMREYLYERDDLPPYMEKYKDIVSWNKEWVSYLNMTPSVSFTSTSLNPEPCKRPHVFSPQVAASWLKSHTKPIGSFRVPAGYSALFKYFPGDDCANSVSQSLYCGGMKTDTLWHPYTSQWIYVPKMWEYLVRSGWKRIPCKDGDVGDILLFDVNRSGTPEHATLITGKAGGRPLYSGHTSHKIDMPVPLGSSDMWWCFHYGEK